MNKRGSLRARVADKKRLAQVRPAQQGLGTDTIMDRELASEYGVAYVHLAAFCIDVDRAYQAATQDGTQDAQLPFGWEVFLTQCYVATQLPTIGDGDGDGDGDGTSANRELLEATCLHILDGDPRAAALGSQLTFAVHDGLQRGLVSELLRPAFRTWRGGTKQLQRELAPLWAQPDENLQRIALRCLSLPMSPAWAPPNLELLQRMARGELSPQAPQPPNTPQEPQEPADGDA